MKFNTELFGLNCEVEFTIHPAIEETHDCPKVEAECELLYITHADEQMDIEELPLDEFERIEMEAWTCAINQDEVEDE